MARAREDPVEVLNRWREHGASWRAVSVRDDRAVVDLLTCYGEPVDRIETDDPRAITFLREHPDSDD
jgi:hypothetical protein